MSKLIPLLASVVALFLLVACGSAPGHASATATTPVPAPKAADIIAIMKSAAVPVTNVVAYDASTDPNHLIGRPHQQVEAVAWNDSRVPPNAYVPGTNGEVTTYKTTKDMQTRATDVATIAAASSMFSEYDYASDIGKFLVRLGGSLTPDQVSTYVKAILEKYPDFKQVQAKN